MSDELMDERLRAAGLAFRGEHADASAPAAAGEPIELAAAASRRRSRPVTLILSAAAVAAALVIGTVLAVRGIGGDHHRGVAGPAPADQLTGRTWTLAEYEQATADGGASGRSTVSGISLTFDGKGEVTLHRRRDTERGSVVVSDDRIEFGALRTVDVAFGPGPTADETQAGIDEQLVTDFLKGTVRWSVTSGQLRLTRGVDSLIFDGPDANTDPTPTDASELFANDWTLGAVTHSTPATSTTDDTVDESVLSFSKNRYDLAQRCSDTTGSVRVEGQHLVFGTPTTNPHSCPAGGDGSLDAVVREALSGSVAWSINDGSLSLTGGSTSLQFNPSSTNSTTGPSVAPDPAAALVANTWRLLGGTHGGTPIDPGIDASKLHLSFTGKGTYSTGGDCYTSDGLWTATGSAIRFVYGTGSACGAQGSDLDIALGSVTQGSVTWKVGNGRLTLTKGSTTLVFSAK